VELVRRIIEDVACPVVLDADGLNAFAGETDRLKAIPAPLVLTPHPGEFARLTGGDPGDVALDPLASARGLAESTGATVVLKGAPTVVASPEGEGFVNPSGNAGLATGGTGDVLAGAIAGLIAQGLPPSAAAALGLYIHGLAGDLAAEARGQAGMIAVEVADLLPEAEQAVRYRRDEGRYLRRHPES
jgi:NAD(P)H-hydrate epimerase